MRIGRTASKTQPNLGPLISGGQHSRVLGYIADGRQPNRAPELVTGGQNRSIAPAYFVEPTVFVKIRARTDDRP